MPKKGYINVRVTPDLKKEIERTAREDSRTEAGQINYLIEQGLRVREKRRHFELQAQNVVAGEPEFVEGDTGRNP